MTRRISAFLVGFLLLSMSPLHAADDIPQLGSTPPPEVLKFLQDLKRQYGPDTVALVSWLLDAANHSGAVLTTSVKVDGNETRDNVNFLVFQVDTGLILNEHTVDQHGRLLTLWERILTKAFQQMETIQIPADGVLVDLRYHHKAFPETDNLADHVDEPGPVEEAKFYFSGDHLRAFLKKELSSQELLGRARVFVDDTPVTLLGQENARKTETAPTNSGNSDMSHL